MLKTAVILLTLQGLTPPGSQLLIENPKDVCAKGTGEALKQAKETTIEPATPESENNRDLECSSICCEQRTQVNLKR